MEQCKYDQVLSGLLDRLQRILSFANKSANQVICEDMKLLEDIMPRTFKVMEMVAKLSCDYVRHGKRSCPSLGKTVIMTRTAGGPVYQIEDVNKALTKIIKYFSRAVDVEALHLAEDTGTSPLCFCPSRSIGAPIGRLPVELWQDILLLAIESDGCYPFATTCTTSTFLHFLEQEKDPDSSYIDYLRRRAALRQVCRAWNQFLESTESWWVHVQDPYHPQKSFDLPPIVDRVAIVKRLTMTITTDECVVPALNWALDLFQMVQAPILSYNINLEVPYNVHFSHNLYDFLAALPTEMALRGLRIACRGRNNYNAISFLQLSANFKGLVSLSISGLDLCDMESLTLPRLELLHISRYIDFPPLPMQWWHLPRLRHVHIHGFMSTPNFNTIFSSLRRYASQLESLFLDGYPSQPGLPHDFWDSFASLQLLGLQFWVLNDHSWSGWDIVPPRSHPFRYLVCKPYMILELTVASLRPMWTYHEGVALVIEKLMSREYYLIEDVKQEGWRMRTSETSGTLPMRRPDRGGSLDNHFHLTCKQQDAY